MAYLLTHPGTSLKTRRRVERIWSRNLVVLPSILTAASWSSSAWLFWRWDALLASMFFGGVGTLTASVPGWYWGRFLRRKQIVFEPPKKSEYNEQSEWSSMLVSIFGIEDELYRFLLTLEPDDFAYPSAYEAWHNVSEVQWDALKQYYRMIPYLRSVRPTTKDILKDELRKLALGRDKAELISNQVLHIGLRSASFTTTQDKSHLDVLARELDAMISSLEDLSANSARQLEVSNPTGEFHDAYLAADSHRVRGAQ